MNPWESLRTALESIGRSRMRSILTMLGIVIGVGAVVALSALGEGVQTMVNDQIEGIGSNMVIVTSFRPPDATGPVQLTMRDAEAIADPFNVPAVVAVAPQVSGQLQATRGDKSASVSVTATTEQYVAIRTLDLASGGFLTAQDVDERARVVVLGAQVYEDLFAPDEYPIGASITLNGARYRVLGVAKAEGGMMSTDSNIYVPITTAQARLFPARTLSGDYPVSMIMASAALPEYAPAASDEIAVTLRDLHGIAPGDDDDFTVTSQQAILDMSGEITGVLTTFLSVIAGISLLVGGIGIMNIMLVTVTERTREIGIRKAIGATNLAVLGQFLVEALMLTLIGGALGVALGYAGSNVAGRLMGLSSRVTAEMLVLAAGVSTLIGLVFGVYPAMRAAQLRPIDALRHE